MAPSKGKEKKDKPASSAESVKKTRSKNELQQQLTKKQASLERASAAYDKASPEKKRQIDGMRNDVTVLRAAVESMDVDPPGQEPNEKGGTLQDNAGMEGTNGNEDGLSLTGFPLGNGAASFKNDDGSKAPGNLGGDGENEPGHEPGAADEGGQLQEPEPARDGAVPGVMPSIETDEPNSPLPPQDDDETAEFEDPGYDRPLLTIPTTSGVSGNGVKTVGWVGKRFRKYINMYGKKSSATYRLENRAYPHSYAENPPEDENVGSAKNRLGDTLPGIGRVYCANAEAPRIWGVAWKGLDSDYLEHDLKLIDPRCVESFAGTVTYVLVGWTMNGQEVKKWETRSAYREAIKSTRLADNNIYKAAVESHHRYIKALGDPQRAFSRSPSLDLLERHHRGVRDRTPSETRKGKSSPSKRGLRHSDRGSSPAQGLLSPRSTVSPERRVQDMGSPAELRGEFIADWLELRGAKDFSNLSAADQQQCVEAWRIHKSKAIAEESREQEAREGSF